MSDEERAWHPSYQAQQMRTELEEMFERKRTLLQLGEAAAISWHDGVVLNLLAEEFARIQAPEGADEFDRGIELVCEREGWEKPVGHPHISTRVIDG